MERIFINDSGHAMDETDLEAYLQKKRIWLLESGKTEEEIEIFIESFFDDCR